MHFKSLIVAIVFILSLLKKKVLWPSVSSDPEVEEYCYMQDSAPPHCTNTALEFLEEKFPDHVINSHSQRLWSTRSQYLNLLDFFVWGYLDSKLPEKNPATIEDAKITLAKKKITFFMIQSNC